MERNTPVPRSDVLGVEWPAIIGPRDAHVLSLLYQLEQTQWWSSERLLDRQLRQAQHLIRHAHANVPFHRGKLESVAQLAPGELTLDEFQNLPILKRADIQQHAAELTSPQVPRGHLPLGKVSTSGSTGSPIEVPTTAITRLLYRTFGLRFHLWHRRDFAAANMSIRLKRQGQPKIFHGHSWAPCYRTGPALAYCATLSIPELFDALIQHEPAYLQAYPSIVSIMVQRSKELGVRPTQLREVRTFGIVLEPEVRELCRDAWDVPISDNYSSMETGIIALQCPESTSLHVQGENVLVEVVDSEGRPCQPGQVGRILVTVLHNFAMPLIRYALGDYAEVAEPCACGRGLATLRRIVGREMHLFTTPSGELFAPNFRTAEFSEIAPVRQVQVVQKTTEQIEVKLATVRPLTEDEEQRLLEHLQSGLHPAFNYRLEYMDEIPRSASGKFEMLRSEVTALRG